MSEIPKRPVGSTDEMKKIIIICLCFIVLGNANLLAGPFRSITAFEHSYYLDRRTEIDWSEVMIFPLPGSFSLVTGINGKHTDDYSALGGSVGLAFNLPGQFYGQSTYALKKYREDTIGGATEVSSLFHSVLVEITYESATWLFSPSVEFKFSGDYLGVMIAPYLRLYPGGWGYFFIKYFGSVAEDRNELVLNNAVWTGLDLRIHPKLSIPVEGAVGSVNEAEIDGMEYTGTTGLNIWFSEKLALKYRFHYTFGESSAYNYERIKNTLVFDLGF